MIHTARRKERQSVAQSQDATSCEMKKSNWWNIHSPTHYNSHGDYTHSFTLTFSVHEWIQSLILLQDDVHTEKRANSHMQWLSCLLRRCYLLHTEVSPFVQTGSLNRPCSHAYIHMVVTLAGTLLLSFTSSYSRGCTHSHAHLYHFCAKLHFQHSVRRRGAEWIHACVYQV